MFFTVIAEHGFPGLQLKFTATLVAELPWMSWYVTLLIFTPEACWNGKKNLHTSIFYLLMVVVCKLYPKKKTNITVFNFAPLDLFLFWGVVNQVLFVYGIVLYSTRFLNWRCSSISGLKFLKALRLDSCRAFVLLDPLCPP